MAITFSDPYLQPESVHEKHLFGKGKRSVAVLGQTSGQSTPPDDAQDTEPVIIPARGATTSNIALSGALTQNGVTFATGDVALVTGQTTQSENGYYTVDTATAWSRAGYGIYAGQLCSVKEGTKAGLWRCTNATDPTVGTDAIAFEEVGPLDGSGIANYSARWSDADTLTTGVIRDDGTNASVGGSIASAARLYVTTSSATQYAIYAYYTGGGANYAAIDATTTTGLASYAIRATHSDSGTAIYGLSNAGTGVSGQTSTGTAVRAIVTNSGNGFSANVTTGNGVFATATTGTALYGEATLDGYGLYVYTNNKTTGDTKPLVYFFQDNAGGPVPTLRVRQDGTGDVAQFQDGGTNVFRILDGGGTENTGGMRLAFNTYSANHTATPANFLIKMDTSGAARTLTLPSAADGEQVYIIRCTGVNNLTVARDGTDTINGAAANLTVTNGQTYYLHSDGVSDWLTELL